MSRGAVLGLPSQAPAPLSFLMTSAYLNSRIVGTKTSSLRGRNMKLWALVVLACAMMLPMELASAADKNGRSVVYGHGNSSCGKFIEAKQKDEQIHILMVMSWVSGYLSRFNYVTPGTYSIFGDTDNASIEAWLHKYCMEYPLKDISDAMPWLIVELHPRRTIQAPN